MRKLFNACGGIGLLCGFLCAGAEDFTHLVVLAAISVGLIIIGMGGIRYMENKDYYCQICGERVLEVVYVANDGEVLGCENCAQIKEPHEMVKYETDRA